MKVSVNISEALLDGHQPHLGTPELNLLVPVHILLIFQVTENEGKACLPAFPAVFLRELKTPADPPLYSILPNYQSNNCTITYTMNGVLQMHYHNQER